MTAEAKLCEDKAAKAMVDAAHLADELRNEQKLAQNLEKDRKVLEAQAKDMQQRLDEAEANALKSGKKAMNKMYKKHGLQRLLSGVDYYGTEEDKEFIGTLDVEAQEGAEVQGQEEGAEQEALPWEDES